MDKQTVIQLRELHNETGLQIFSDNAKLYSEKNEGTFIIWDDDKAILHTIRPNNSHYNQDARNCILESFSYEVIEYITSAANPASLDTIVEGFKTSGILTDEKAKEIVKFYKGINNKL